jgi:hypothetical protein
MENLNLVKIEETTFKVDVEKSKKFKLDDILFLSGKTYEPKTDNIQKYVAFKNRDEFFEKMNIYNIDRTKDIIINDKGFFFCPLVTDMLDEAKKEVVNESTNTQEDKGE